MHDNLHKPCIVYTAYTDSDCNFILKLISYHVQTKFVWIFWVQLQTHRD